MSIQSKNASKIIRPTRRSVLGGLGGLGMSSALLPFIPRDARAQGAAPKRILFYFHSMGYLEEYFWPSKQETDAVDPGNFATNFSLGSSLQALEPYKDKMILVDGINAFGVGVSNLTYRICDNGHGKGIKMMFTGAKTLASNGMEPTNARDMECTNDLASGWQPAGGPSLDHVLAQRVGRETPFKTINLAVSAGQGTHQHAFWTGANQPITGESNPQAAFNRLFGNLTGDSQLAMKLQSRRQSIIDVVRDEVNRLNSRLGSSQQIKLENHLTAIRELENRLNIPAPNCPNPTAPSSGSTGSKVGQPAQDAIRGHMDVLVNAFRCDMTRVATLQLGHADDGPIPSGLPLERHPSAHSVTDGNPEQQDAITSYRRTDEWYSSHLAYMLQRMDAIDEGDGSMLDNTLIIFGTDTQGWLRQGGIAHASTRWPMMLIGGKNHFFPTGRYIKTAHYDINGSTDDDPNFPSHHRVLVSIARKFGLDIDTFGSLDPAVVTNAPGGPLAELEL